MPGLEWRRSYKVIWESGKIKAEHGPFKAMCKMPTPAGVLVFLIVVLDNTHSMLRAKMVQYWIAVVEVKTKSLQYVKNIVPWSAERAT